VVNLSQKIRRSVHKIRRFTYLNPALINEKYVVKEQISLDERGKTSSNGNRKSMAKIICQ